MTFASFSVWSKIGKLVRSTNVHEAKLIAKVILSKPKQRNQTVPESLTPSSWEIIARILLGE